MLPESISHHACQQRPCALLGIGHPVRQRSAAVGCGSGFGRCFNPGLFLLRGTHEDLQESLAGDFAFLIRVSPCEMIGFFEEVFSLGMMPDRFNIRTFTADHDFRQSRLRLGFQMRFDFLFQSDPLGILLFKLTLQDFFLSCGQFFRFSFLDKLQCLRKCFGTAIAGFYFGDRGVADGKTGTTDTVIHIVCERHADGQFGFASLVQWFFQIENDCLIFADATQVDGPARSVLAVDGAGSRKRGLILLMRCTGIREFEFYSSRFFILNGFRVDFEGSQGKVPVDRTTRTLFGQRAM